MAAILMAKIMMSLAVTIMGCGCKVKLEGCGASQIASVRNMLACDVR